MPYRVARAEHFVVVSWGEPLAEDFARLPGEVARAEQAAGRRLCYVGILPEDMPRIDDDARKGFLELTENILPHCEIVLVVFEARGFRGAIMRSAMATVTLLTRRYDRLKFVDSVETALGIAGDRLPADPMAVRRALREVGHGAQPQDPSEATT